MGVFPDPGFRIGDLNFFEHLDRRCHRFSSVIPVVSDKHLGYLVSDRIKRVQGCHGLLEYHGDFIPPDIPHFLFGQGEQIGAVENDFTLFNFTGRRLYQSHNR